MTTPKNDPRESRRIELEVEVPGTPEEVWEAIARVVCLRPDGILELARRGSISTLALFLIACPDNLGGRPGYGAIPPPGITELAIRALCSRCG